VRKLGPFLFDDGAHLVGNREQRQRHLNPGRLAVCKVDDEFELARLYADPLRIATWTPQIGTTSAPFPEWYQGRNGGGHYATDFDDGCVELHDADCCQCIRTVKPCSEPDSIGCVTQ
jgi:hypothetical protein